MKLFCVEVGCRQTRKMWRTTSSTVVLAQTPVEAIAYVKKHFPDAVAYTEVERVFEAKHVFVDWTSSDIQVAEKD